MKRLLIVPAVAGVAVAEVIRRGFAAPVLFGVKLWADAILGYRPTATDEPEPI